MKRNQLYTAGATITAITLNYYDGTTQATVALPPATITPLLRGLVVRFETTAALVTTITNVVISESGIILDALYYQFSQFLEAVFAYCPASAFTYGTLTDAQALYLEAMFAGMMPSLIAGLPGTTATAGEVKSYKTPVGSEVSFYANTESVYASANYEIMQPAIIQAAKVLCGLTSVPSLAELLPFFSAYGLRIEQGVLETIIDLPKPESAV